MFVLCARETISLYRRPESFQHLRSSQYRVCVELANGNSDSKNVENIQHEDEPPCDEMVKDDHHRTVNVPQAKNNGSPFKGVLLHIKLSSS